MVSIPNCPLCVLLTCKTRSAKPTKPTTEMLGKNILNDL